MRKILYIMHIDWKWIKQRPQFLAEELNKGNRVLVIYPFSNRRKYLQKNKNSTRISKFPLLVFPYASKFKVSEKLNRIFHRLTITIVNKIWRPDHIWITYPNNIRMISEKTTTPIIYDCMDSYKDMTSIDNSITEIIKNEKRLVDRASLVFCSSEYLKERLVNDYCIEKKKITTLRNGYNGKLIPINSADLDQYTKKRNYKIGYVGTISHWFDWKKILHSLNYIDNIEYHIIGPLEIGMKIVKHPRIIYHGVVAHEELYEKVINYDCLCMPFIVDEIIKAVDPVKLYEYINFNKNIICIYYDEISRFQDFVHFYETAEQLTDSINKIIKDNKLKYSKEMRLEFLEKNSWSERVSKVDKYLSRR